MATKRVGDHEQSSISKKRQKTASKPKITDEQEREVDFPRGGASALSPLEVRRIKQEAEKDVLFGKGQEETTKKKKKKTKSKKKTSNDDEDKDEQSIEYESSTKLKHVESLSFKKLIPGMKLLGVVREVNQFEMIISLPNGLTGFVNIFDINEKISSLLASQDEKLEEEEEDDIPSLEDLFDVNTLIVCVIKEINPEKHGNKKIKLSVKPDGINNGMTNITQGMVLNGFVSSEEDHGYVVLFGIPGKSGFLSKKQAPPGSLRVGQPVQVLVKSADKEGRVITLSLNQEKINSAMVTDEMKPKFSSLVPGMLVKTTVKECTSSGLLVSFLGMFEGSASLIHLPDNGEDGVNLEEKYKKKSKLVGRILHVNPKNKSVGFSFHPSIIANAPHTFGELAFGDIIDNATIVRMDQGLGLLMKVMDSFHGYVHISHVSDSHVDKLGKKYKAGTEHRCRVLGFNSVDGLVSLTMEKSVIERPFLRYHDIKVGSVVECKIITLEKFGMLVSVSQNIRGLVTTLHFADIILKHPEKKLKDGKDITCRVLSVDPEKRRLQLTHKKTLVSSTLPIITQYSDAKRGMSTHGFITSIREHGCIVTFYNNVKGFIPKSELSIQPQEDPRQVFYVGQVLTCHVIDCQPEQGKMKLSLKIPRGSFPCLMFTHEKTHEYGYNLNKESYCQGNDPWSEMGQQYAQASSALASPTSNQQGTIKTGTMVDIDVVASSSEGLDVIVQPKGSPALLPVSHLSDHPGHCEPLLNVYKPSEKPVRISDVLYYGQGNKKTNIVSLKPSLKAAAQNKKNLKNFEDLEVGMVLQGFVRQIMGYGVFIEFAPRIFGLAPNSFLANQFVSDASAHFKIGQSVIAKVAEIDEERKRFLVSLKQSDIMSDNDGQWDPKVAVELLQDYLKEQEMILENIASKSEKAKNLLSLKRGSCIEAKVRSVKKHGITLHLANGLKGFVPHQLAQGVSCQEGEIVYGIVLDHNIDNMMADMTLMPKIAEERRKEMGEKPKKKKIKINQALDCSVQLIKADYMIVCLDDHHHSLAFAPSKMHLNDITDPSKKFVIGQNCIATVHSSQPCIVVLPERSISSANIQPGIETTAVVKSVKGLQMNVQLDNFGLNGRVHICHAADVIEEGSSPLRPYHPTDKIKVKVLGIRDAKTHKFLPLTHKNFIKAFAELSLKSSDLASSSVETEYKEKKLEDYKIGDKVTAFVKSATDHCVWMVVSTSVTGRLSLLQASSDMKVLTKLASHFKQGNGYTCHVIGVDSTHDALDLSITYKPDDTLHKGQVIPGRISRVKPSSGLFVQLPLNKCGMVSLTDIQDRHTENPLGKFKERQIVKCYILGQKDDEHFDLSLRPSRTEAESTKNQTVDDGDYEPAIDRDIEDLTDLDVGDLVKGYIKAIGKAGVFVSLSHTIVARVQIKNLSHYFVKDWKPLFPPGKLVTGKILSIDPSTGHVELSLKGKDTGLEDPAPNPKKKDKEKSKKRKRTADSGDNDDDDDDDGDNDDEETMLKKLKADESESEEEKQDTDIESEESDDEDGEEDMSEEEEIDVDVKKRSSTVPRLQVSGGFDWNAADNEDEDNQRDDSEDSSDSETETAEQVSRKKSKRQKRAEKKAEEDFLYRTEQALLDQDRAPESAEDFDRLVLTSPNNSVLWLQYMAFYLHTTEIEKARMVAERAIKTMSFREEREKLNIWVALMNLENLYGTQDTLVKVFERALQHNDPKKVFFHLITIYSKSDKNELAEQLFHSMTKRFSQSKKVWIEFGRFYMKNGKLESARKILQRGLKSLPKRKHLETVIQFAIMEFKHGDPQRGQTVMEEVLSNYPKRSDLWSVYIDMMAKQGDPEAVRNIFERVIHMNLSSRKMKFFFKRYLAFEREYGDDLSVENVKTKAMEYVESKVALN